jgi:hypothetical protein
MLDILQRLATPPKPATRRRVPVVTVTAEPVGHGNSERWVPAVRPAELPTPPISADLSHTIDVRPNATQHAEYKTSSVDRALGYLIASVPLYGAFALGVTVSAVALFSVPVLSFAAFLVYWLSFVVAWLAGYVYTLAVSVEGVSFYEARQKWAVIREEQRRRWAHYEETIRGDR